MSVENFDHVRVLRHNHVLGLYESNYCTCLERPYLTADLLNYHSAYISCPVIVEDFW